MIYKGEFTDGKIKYKLFFDDETKKFTVERHYSKKASIDADYEEPEPEHTEPIKPKTKKSSVLLDDMNGGDDDE